MQAYKINRTLEGMGAKQKAILAIALLLNVLWFFTTPSYGPMVSALLITATLMA